MASNDRILVSAEAMQEAIQKYQSARDTLQDSFKQLENAKEHIDRVYNGAAYVALAAKWVTIYANARTAENGIDESVKGLQATITTMNQAESDVGSKFTSLETGSKPTFM